MDRDELRSIHGAMPDLVDRLRAGRLGRRDFLRMAALLGMAAPLAYAIAGRLTGEGPVGAARAQAPETGGVLRIAMSVQEITDPATIDWSEKGNELRLVIEPLTRVGTDNITRPYLAERWEASDDLATWTFHLRRGVKWSNGDDFTADDVIFNFERWLDPATGSSNQSRFSSLTETVGDSVRMRPGALERVDDHTVRFHLAHPDLALPENMGDYPALLVHRGFKGNFLDDPVGTGPYSLTEFAVGERAVYQRRDRAAYWNDGFPLDGVVYIDLGEDPAAPLAALVSDQVDLIFRISTDQVPAARALPGLRLYETVTGSTGVARMKVTAPPFDDVRVRRAIRACIDHRRLTEIAFQNLGVPGEDHHVSPIHPEYADLPDPVQDYELARRLLAEAGHGDGLEIAIDCVASPTWEPNTCQAIAEMLKPAGINLAVNVLPGGVYWERWLEAPFGFTAWAHRPLGVQTLNLAYRCGVAWNETSYCNPAFDETLDRAMGTLDIEARRGLMAELERMMQDDSIVIQPFWRSTFTASSQRVNGFSLHPAEELHLDQVWLSPA